MFPAFLESYFNSLILCDIKCSKARVLLIQNCDSGSLVVGLSVGSHAW